MLSLRWTGSGACFPQADTGCEKEEEEKKRAQITKTHAIQTVGLEGRL